MCQDSCGKMAAPALQESGLSKQWHCCQVLRTDGCNVSISSSYRRRCIGGATNFSGDFPTTLIFIISDSSINCLSSVM